MTKDSADIMRLADAAKIRLSDTEATVLLQDIEPLFKLAESLADAEIPEATFKGAAISISELRADIPMRADCLDEIFDQAPSGGGRGFTIPRLLE